MRYVAICGALGAALFVSGCHWLPEAKETAKSICDREQLYHEIYVNWIAPFRPASAVAMELAFYNNTMAACKAGADIIAILEASNKAAEARK